MLQYAVLYRVAHFEAKSIDFISNKCYSLYYNRIQKGEENHETSNLVCEYAG